MANPAGIIDSVVARVDGQAPSDGDLDARRLKLAEFLNQLNSYVHNYHEWEWTYYETTFSIAAGADFAYIYDTVTSPGPPPVVVAGKIPDFLEWGRQGSLYTGQIPMWETSRAKIQRARRINAGPTRNPYAFAIWSGAIQLVAPLSSTTDYVAFHRIRAEQITDPDDTTELLLPDRYYQTVLYPGMIWKAMEGKQDQRETWANQFTEGLSQMSAIENPIKTQRCRLPLAMIGVW